MINKDLKNARILIVDDSETNIAVVKAALELAGYTNIESTTDSRKTLDLVNSFDPDLILLDLNMPFFTGFDIMDLLKVSLSIDKYLPVLVLTADVTPETRLKALAAGAKDFLSKPFDLIEVRLRIKNLLETQYLFQLMKSKNQTLEDKIVNFLKISNEWYR